MSETEARSLNVAVARAMGCEPRREIIERNGPMELWFCTCDECDHTDDEGFRLLYAYSKDPAMTGDMLEHAKYFYPKLYAVDSDDGELVWRAELTDAYGGRFAGDGSTPQEALAKAIAAIGTQER